MKSVGSITDATVNVPLKPLGVMPLMVTVSPTTKPSLPAVVTVTVEPASTAAVMATGKRRRS